MSLSLTCREVFPKKSIATLPTIFISCQTISFCWKTYIKQIISEDVIHKIAKSNPNVNTLVTHRTDIIKTQAKINTDMIHKIDNLTILTKGTTLKVDNPTKPPATISFCWKTFIN